jgi:hypothetical protein
MREEIAMRRRKAYSSANTKSYKTKRNHHSESRTTKIDFSMGQPSLSLRLHCSKQKHKGDFLITLVNSKKIKKELNWLFLVVKARSYQID